KCCSEGSRVIRLVGKQAARKSSCNERFRRTNVVALALGELEGERQAERIDNKVNFRGKAAPRTTYPLRRGSPLPPAACWCAPGAPLRAGLPAQEPTLTTDRRSVEVEACCAPWSMPQAPWKGLRRTAPGTGTGTGTAFRDRP